MFITGQPFRLMPPVIKNLMIINGLFYLATHTFYTTFGIELTYLLGLYFPASDHFMPHQLFTHMFMHGSFGHILSNMFMLWMLGSAMENYWGGKRFLTYYILTGLGASALQLGVNAIEYYNLIGGIDAIGMEVITREGLEALRHGNYTNEVYAKMNSVINTPMVGASGAVFGVLLAFGMTFPNERIYLNFLFPIKAKYFVMGYGAIELFNGFSNSGGNIAHFAHLGGMLFGYLLIKKWRSNRYV